MNRVETYEGFDHSEEMVSAPLVRYDYMDNLRALAMMAGIFFHAALAYSPMLANIWPSADVINSTAVDAVAWFSHLFRMPLFFLIAGFFSCYMIEKRGIVGLLKNRVLRILLPFAIFLPLVLISIGKSIEWAVFNIENPSPMLQFVAYAMNAPNAEGPPVTTTHLWFLYNLCFFYIIYGLLHKLGILKLGWMKLISSAKFVVIGLPLLLVPALMSQFIPHPAPEQFVPQWWSFAFFGVFFIMGSQLFLRQELIDELKPYTVWLFVISIGLYVVLFTHMPKELGLVEIMAMQQGVAISWSHVGNAALEAYIAVHMTLVCLVVGKAILNRASGVLRMIADSSYWVYIIHIPLLFLIQFLLLDVQWGMWTKFAVSSFGTLGVGLVTYFIFVRWTPIGWMLNGRK